MASPKLPPSPALPGRAQALKFPSSPFSPKENSARGRMKEGLAIREKTGEEKEKGGFQTEYLYVEGEQGYEHWRLFTSTYQKTQNPQHSVH